MISYLGSLVQFSPAMGRAGRCRQTSLCVGSTRRVPATLGLPLQGCLCFPRLHCSGSRLLYRECALCCLQFQFSGPPQKRGFGCACVLCLPRLSGPGSQRLARILLGAMRLFPPQRAAPAARGLRSLFPSTPHLFPPRPQRAPPVGSQEVFKQEPGPVCRVGGGGFSGAEFAPCPSPLPPPSSGDGPALLCSFSVPLFCEPP